MWRYLQMERRVYVAAWAGDAVQQSGLHPPFNLMLRILVALCPDIIIPVSRQAGEAFDKANKPFESGEGITEDYSVQQLTSANTALQARLLLLNCGHSISDVASMLPMPNTRS